MANETIIINGVTKREWFGTFWYKFANGTLIEANPFRNTYTVYDIDKYENKTTAFADITDPLGASTIVEYIEALIGLGAYKDNSNITVSSDVTETNTGFGSNVIHSNIPASLTAVVLLPQNSLRRETHITNNSNGILFVKYGGGVTSTNYTYKLFRSDSVTIDDYRGEITGVGLNALGFYMIEENSY